MPSGRLESSKDNLTNFEREQLGLKEREAASQRRKMVIAAERQRSIMERQQSRERERHREKLASAHSRIVTEKRNREEQARAEAQRRQQIEDDQLNKAWTEKMIEEEFEWTRQQRLFEGRKAQNEAIARALVQSRFESANQRTREVAALKGLFQRINSSGSGAISESEMLDILRAMGAQPTTRALREALREFGGASRQVSFHSFLQWWDDFAVGGLGDFAEWVKVTVQTPQTSDKYSPLRWVANVHKCMDEHQNRLQLQKMQICVVRIQSSFRGRVSARRTALMKTTSSLPGSMRIRVLRIQTLWRMRRGRKQFARMQSAQRLIAKRFRVIRARALFELERTRKRQEGFDIAGRTVHIGGLGGVWETAPLGAELLKRRFSGFGHVLTAVVRYRAPTDGSPHNSWALLSFVQLESVARLWQAGNGGDTVLLEAQECKLRVRRINPEKVMSSTGYFGLIFRMCLQNVDEQRERMAAKRLLVEEQKVARDARLAQLAKPNLKSARDGDAGSDEQIVVDCHYGSGWLRCQCAATMPDSPDPIRKMRTYWFNELSGEARWDPPPDLAKLASDRIYTRKGRLQSATPYRIASKGPLRDSIRVQTTKRYGLAAATPGPPEPYFESSASFSEPGRCAYLEQQYHATFLTQRQSERRLHRPGNR
eukprot:COSAG01_NODE_538_length_15761_cov_8.160388_8_plen_655_part_00